MSTKRSDLRTGNRGIGIMFFSFFGTWWLCLGCRGLFGTNPLDLVPALLLGAVLFVAGRQIAKRAAAPVAASASSEASPRASQRRTFRNVNIAQWAAIVTLIVILNVMQRVEWIVPGIMLIVGMHFFPLARLFNTKSHYLTGTALSALAVSYPWIAAQGPASPIGPLGAGLILITAACASLIGAARQRP